MPQEFKCAIGIESNKAAKIDIYIFSSPGCGYCLRAFKDIGEWAQSKPVNVIAMDVSGNITKIRATENLRKLYQEYHIQLIDASPCGEKYSLFIPKIFIFDNSKGEQIFKMKGWAKGDIAKVKKKLQKYL